MVSEPVEEGGEARGVGKDGSPVFEGEVGSQGESAAGFVAGIDDMVEKVGGMVVVGKVAKLVNADESWPEVLTEAPPSLFGRVAIELIEQFGGGAVEHGVAGEDGVVGDVFEDHGFADAVGTEEDEVSAFGDEVETEGGVDGGAVDVFGPAPVEVGHGLESSESGAFETSFEASVGFVFGFEGGELLQDGGGGPLVSGGSSDEVLKVEAEGS